MRTRSLEPTDPMQSQQQDRPSTTEDGDEHAEARLRQSERLLEIGDAAIARVLSRRPETFLSENRQQGGQ